MESPATQSPVSRLPLLLAPFTLTVLLDQLSKWWVRTTPELHRVDVIEGWFQLYYTLNPGMALGLDWFPTPVVSSVAITATIGIFIYVMINLSAATRSYLVCMGFVLGGAVGNIIDRLFLGLVEGYGGVLEGHVVDFLHFDLQIAGTAVFPYIFNVADVAISVSIGFMILFHRRVIPTQVEPTPPS